MVERLTFLMKLNDRMRQIPQIYESQQYWGLIQAGIAHLDQVPRKISLSILKENLSTKSYSRTYSTDEEFEQLWTVFFDLMDTLEGFGGHLLKAVWHRIDIFYDFIKKNDEVYA